MATRTYKIAGKAWGASPVTVTVQFNGTEVFNGTVTTAADESSAVFAEDFVTFTADTSVHGDIPMVMTVSEGGTAVFGEMKANQNGFENSIALSDADRAAAYEANEQPLNTGESTGRTSVTIGGEAQTPGDPSGGWQWMVEGTTLTWTVGVDVNALPGAYR